VKNYGREKHTPQVAVYYDARALLSIWLWLKHRVRRIILLLYYARVFMRTSLNP